MQIKSKTMPVNGKNNKGFTLVELMVTLAISTIVLAGIYAAYNAQMRSHVTQQVVVDIQQNLRSSMYYLQRSIRMAGLGVGAGFVDDFTSFIEPYASSAVTRDATNIAYTIDMDDDGEIDGSTGANVDNVDNELIAFRFNGNTLERYLPSIDDWQPVAENIDAANSGFSYLDAANNPTAIPAEIRSVQITITAQPVEEIYARAVAKRPHALSVQIRCRNL